MVKNGEIRKTRAEALKVSRKNIYQGGILEKKDHILKGQIEAVHKEHPAYGHRRVADELGINRKRALRVMRKYGIKPPRRKKKPVWTTRSVENCQYQNLVKGQREFEENELWCSDLSYLKYQGRKWYLGTIIDVATRRVVGVRVGKHHDSPFVLSLVKEACRNRQPQIFHSDQGTEFMADICTNYLEERGVNISVSDAGSPWQNGYQESFFGRFKEEFGDFNRFDSEGEFIEAIYQYVWYYNEKRIHTALRMPPAKFAKLI